MCGSTGLEVCCELVRTNLRVSLAPAAHHTTTNFVSEDEEDEVDRLFRYTHSNIPMKNMI